MIKWTGVEEELKPISPIEGVYPTDIHCSNDQYIPTFAYSLQSIGCNFQTSKYIIATFSCGK